MKVGTEEHKQQFCRQFIASHLRYQPEDLPWPELDELALTRLRAIPFWQEVLHTERRAGAIVDAFAGTVSDPLVREAIEVEAIEEARHARLIEVMIERYGISAALHPLEPIGADRYVAFTDFGFGECLDSFLGFGVFQIARGASFLPESMFAIFDMLMIEETRHIVFFINWMAWQEVQRGRGMPWLRGAIALWYYGRAIGRLLGTVRRGRGLNDGKDFSATQAGVFLDGFNFRRFVEACCAENARRMAEFAPDLLQPRFLPALAETALSGLRLIAPRAATRR